MCCSYTNYHFVIFYCQVIIMDTLDFPSSKVRFLVCAFKFRIGCVGADHCSRDYFSTHFGAETSYTGIASFSTQAYFGKERSKDGQIFIFDGQYLLFESKAGLRCCHTIAPDLVTLMLIRWYELSFVRIRLGLLHHECLCSDIAILESHH